MRRLVIVLSLYFFMVFCSYALFDMEGKKVPQTLVTQVGGVFESLLEEVQFVICAHVMLICCKTSYFVGCKEYVWLHKNLFRKCLLSDVMKSCLFVKFQTKKLRDEHTDDMSVLKAFTLVLERRPDLRLVIHGIQTLYSYRLLSFSLVEFR